MFMKRTGKDYAIDAVIYAIMAILAITTLTPLLNVLAISLSDSAKASAGVVTVYPLGFNLTTYATILKDRAILTAAGVSAQRVVLSLVVDMVLALLASYPLSKDKRKFPFRDVYMWIVLATMLFPPSLIPMFFTVRDLKLTGTIWSLVLPGAVGQFYIILIMNYFRSLPAELDESASIDGAGAWRRLVQIYLPLSKPIIATIALFIVVFSWNAYFDGLIYAIRTEDYPLQTYIQQLVVNLDTNIRDVEKAREKLALSSRSLTAAKLVITMIPIIVIYPFMQKYFIAGITLGSVKE